MLNRNRNGNRNWDSGYGAMHEDTNIIIDRFYLHLNLVEKWASEITGHNNGFSLLSEVNTCLFLRLGSVKSDWDTCMTTAARQLGRAT